MTLETRQKLVAQARKGFDRTYAPVEFVDALLRAEKQSRQAQVALGNINLSTEKQVRLQFELAVAEAEFSSLRTLWLIITGEVWFPSD